MTSYNKIADILETSADIIERDGHAKHIMENEIGQKCATGAMGAAIAGTARPFNWYIGSAVCKVICDALKIPKHYSRDYYYSGDYDYVSDVVDWNNADSTTAQEVIDGLRKSAKLALRKADGND